MIDFVKFQFLVEDVNLWVSKYYIDNRVTSDRIDDELLSETFAFDGWKVEVRNKEITISGSLHKWAKQKNWNEFNLLEIEQSISYLEQLFHFDSNQTQLRTFEFGFNIPVIWCNYQKLIKSFKLHKFKPFYPFINSSIVSSVVEHSQYRLKTYDKTEQSKAPIPSLVRCELKVRKMAFVEKLGIKTLNDLRVYTKLESIKNLVLKKLEESMVIKECTELAGNVDYLRFTNKDYWANLNTAERSNAKKRFDTLSRKYEWSKDANLLQKCIEQKWMELTNVTPQKIEITMFNELERFFRGNIYNH